MDHGTIAAVEHRSSLYRLLREDQAESERRSGSATLRGPSCGQAVRGACRSKRLGSGEHVPDRLGEPAGNVDLGDLGAALASEAAFVALVALPVDGMRAGVGCRLQQRPAQVARAALGQRAASVAVARLVDPRAKTRVARKLGGRGKAGNVA